MVYDNVQIDEVESVPSTCNTCGYTTYKGTVIINGYTAESEHTFTLDALGHSWGEGVVTKAATADAKGEMTYTCSVCNATKTAAISFDGETGKQISDATADTVDAAIKKMFETYDDADAIEKAVSDDDLMKLDALNQSADNGIVETEVYSSKSLKGVKVEGASLTASYYKNQDTSTDENVTYKSYVDIYLTDSDEYDDYDMPEDAVVLDIDLAVERYVNGEYDDDFEDSTGYDVQPAAPIRISMYLPDALKDKAFELYHYTDNGKEQIDYTLDGDVITFVVTALSPYSFEPVDSEDADPTCTHEWDAGVTTKEATCTQAGVKTYTCSKCNGTKTETIPALGHEWKDGVVTKEATCTEAGSKTYTCSRCNMTKTETIKALDHNWDAGVTTKEATCTEAGSILYTCTTCQETKTEAIDALGHDYQLTDSKEASYTEEGYKTYTCTRCQDVRTDKIPVLAVQNNAISSPDEIVKTYSKKAQSFAIGAGCQGGAALSYASNNSSVTVNAAGVVTIRAKYMGNAVITITSSAVPGYNAAVKTVKVSVGPTKTSLSSVKNVKGKKIQIKWKKNKIATGYQIQVSYDPGFASAKSCTIKKNKIVTKTVSKLAKGKVCYVRIRSYKKTSTGNAFAPWSKVKKVKIKK